MNRFEATMGDLESLTKLICFGFIGIILVYAFASTAISVIIGPQFARAGGIIVTLFLAFVIGVNKRLRSEIAAFANG